jgi:hypothetical protein
MLTLDFRSIFQVRAPIETMLHVSNQEKGYAI